MRTDLPIFKESSKIKNARILLEVLFPIGKKNTNIESIKLLITPILLSIIIKSLLIIKDYNLLFSNINIFPLSFISIDIELFGIVLKVKVT